MKTSVASENKTANTAIRKLVFLAKKWRSSEAAWVQGSCNPEEKHVLTVKAGYGGTEGVPGENLVQNTIEGTKGGRYIYMRRLKTGASNEVPATEVLVVRNNLASWAWLTPMLGSRRVGLFVSEQVIWIIAGGWIESSIGVIGFRTLASAIHSIGMEKWNYALCLIKGRRNFISDIFIQLRSVRPGISILGVVTGRHSKISKDLLLHSAIKGFYVSPFCHCDVGGVTRAPYILSHNINEEGSVREDISRKVIRKLDAVVRVQEQCAVGCTVLISDETGIEDVREISTHPSTSQL